MEKDIERHKIFQLFPKMTCDEAVMLNPLKLAYVGDSVYELIIRLNVLKREGKLKDLHNEKVSYVNAASQAKILYEIEPHLTETERDIVRRGRNTKVKSVAKNSSLMDYKHATALEALIGYLFLTDNEDRLYNLLDMGLRCLE